MAQYGWSGAGIPVYTRVAPTLLSRWKPSETVILLNADDVYVNALERSPVVSAVRCPELIPEAQHSGTLGYIDALRARSVLCNIVANRVREILRSRRKSPPGENNIDSAAIETALRKIRNAYGPRLSVVYIPQVEVTAPDKAELGEAALLRACSAVEVRCSTVRPVLVDAFRKHNLLTAGFHNTAPGVGHLNATGHRLVAVAISRLLDERRADHTRGHE